MNNNSTTIINSVAPEGVTGRHIKIEVDSRKGRNKFTIIGLPDKAIEESKERIDSAIKNSGFESPSRKPESITISLAPANIKKSGTHLDLGISVGYLASVGLIKNLSKKYFYIGELSLSGNVVEVSSILPLLKMIKEMDKNAVVFIPEKNKELAKHIDSISIIPVSSLKEVIYLINNKQELQNRKLTYEPPVFNFSEKNSVAEIKGQMLAKRAIEIAVTGRHNILLYGPPGTGKSHLAKSIKELFEISNKEELLEITSIQSLDKKSSSLVSTPFCSPHHSASDISILGGGKSPTPGEVTRAHNGVLFLDELPEFSRSVLEGLRQPLEDKSIRITRASGVASFPANIMLVATMNPCPCGNYGSRFKSCSCSAHSIQRYQKKLSGPILDRIDIKVQMDTPSGTDLGKDSLCQYSINSRNRIRSGIQFCMNRSSNKDASYNDKLKLTDINSWKLSKEVISLMSMIQSRQHLSPRSYIKILKISRTIADIDQSESITKKHILESLQFNKAPHYQN